MTRVDFYVVSQQQPAAAAVAACRLAEKAYKRGLRVLLLAEDAACAQQLDELLWTFRAGSFVPHALHGESTPEAPAVIISAGEDDEDIHDVLINLGGEIPAYFSRFERVAEMVAADDTARVRGRERFRFYRERGYELHSHQL